MVYDRPITITVGNNRKSINWQPQSIMLSEFYEKLRIPSRSTETMQEYLGMKKSEQDNKKDIGGFVAGSLSGVRRKAGAVTGRDVITLDFDTIPPGGANEILKRVDALGCGYCIYSTRKHSPANPRLRILLPFDRTATVDEYEPTARYMAACIGIEFADPTTFEATRLMYWPSCCVDSEYIFTFGDKPMLSVDGLLNTITEKYGDWRDVSKWPQVPGADNAYKKLAMKQSDPLSKSGVVGAFCRTYDIYGAMDAFLDGIYEAVDNSHGRYTYLGGSTTGGAVVYDNGTFLYSHHSTDPCCGRLVNAFDLVRLHKFGDMDDAAQPGTPVGRLPSYTAMKEMAENIDAVSEILARERVASVIDDFGSIIDEDNAADLGRYEGKPMSEKTVEIALNAFKIQAKQNLVTGRAEIIGMPNVYSKEEAINTLPVFLLDRLKAIGVKGVNKTAIGDYLANILDRNRFNPVLDMLHNTLWDGTSRFPGLLKILSIDPGSFDALLIKKWLIQCVALAHNTREDIQAAEGVLVLQGDQGAGKTFLFRRLAIKSDWLSEGVTLDMKSKDDILRATGAWITELGELDSTLKKEQSSLKAFITQRLDRIRAPYAKEASDRPRRTSFCATVNPGVFLKDDTGDRRWWVVRVCDTNPEALAEIPEEWFIQLWAEVYDWWKNAPQGFRLSRSERDMLNQSNQRFHESLPGEEELREMLDFDLPQTLWQVFSPTAIKKRFFISDKISVVQIGRVLSKMEREDNRICHFERQRVKYYSLPIKNDFRM